MNERETLVSVLEESYVRAGRPDHVLAALSGGGDSAALALLLRDLAGKMGFRLTCAHVNHGLPGSGPAEEEWVRMFANAQGLALLVKAVSVPNKGNMEANAREARYRALRELRREASADVIAVAHHADDQAETLLMHLLRGTGTSGLAGMRELRGGIWRPLLGTPREQVHKYLLSAGVPWLEDLTNDDPSLTRGFLRHRVLPLLEEGFPGASRRLAQAAQVVGADEDAWADMEESWLVRFARRDPPFVYLLKRPFLAQSLAMRRRLVRRLCAAYGIGVDFTQTGELLALAAGPEDGEMNLPGGAKAYCAEKALHILPNAIESTHVRWEQPEVLAPDGSLGDGVRVQALDAGIAQGAEMRQWEYGDMITPLGMRGSMPITKYLGGRRVDIPWRRFWPVYARGRDVLWVPGLGISEYAAVRPGTKEIVKLRFRGMLPWDRGAKEGADGTE